MVLHNTTFAVDPAQEKAFLSYLKERYIPTIHQGGVLKDEQLHRVLGSHIKNGCVSYALHFYAEGIDELSGYLAKKEVIDLQQEMAERFGENLTGFMSVLEVVNL